MPRTLVVGDVHGCRDELARLLERAAFTTGDRLVFVGDLVARGPDPAGVMAIVRETGARVVRGNHEQKLITWAERKETPLGPAHRGAAETLGAEDWALLGRTPLWLDLPEHGARVVHAGVLPGIPIDQQAARTLLTIRTVRAGDASDAAEGLLWGALYDGPPHVLFGHHAREAVQIHPWATGIDTGCVYGGALTAMVLDEGEPVPAAPRDRAAHLVSMKAARAYWSEREKAARA